MEKNSSPSSATETKFADHTVIIPPNRLKNFVSHSGQSTEIAIDVIFRAEAALEEIKGEFADWMNQECEALENAHSILKTSGPTLPLIQKVFFAAHDVKGQAALFGFPFAGRIAASLCRLILHAPDPIQIPIVLIDRHVEAIRAVVREGVQNSGDKTGAEIQNRLSLIVETFLSQQLGEKYGTIAPETAALPKMSAPKV